MENISITVNLRNENRNEKDIFFASDLTEARRIAKRLMKEHSEGTINISIDDLNNEDESIIRYSWKGHDRQWHAIKLN